MLDYRSPVAGGAASRRAARAVLIVTLLVPADFVAAVLLRRHQLSLPDPCNNPYADGAMVCLLGFFGLAVADLVLLAVLRQRVERRVRYLAWCVVGIAGLYLGWFVFGALLFVCL